MAEDIVERLRGYVEWLRKTVATGNYAYSGNADIQLFSEAAAEIERLRKEIEIMTPLPSKTQQAEIELLRTSLSRAEEERDALLVTAAALGDLDQAAVLQHVRDSIAARRKAIAGDGSLEAKRDA